MYIVEPMNRITAKERTGRQPLHNTARKKEEAERTCEPRDGGEEEAHVAIDGLIGARHLRRVVRRCDRSREERVRKHPRQEYAARKEK